MTVDELSQKLCKGKFSSLSITCNDHACNYATLERWLVDYAPEEKDEYISPEELQKAIDTNTSWCLQWYPDTPVSFKRVFASTFEALLNYAEEIQS